MSEQTKWTTTLFACEEDWSICCRTFWCPPCVYADHGQLIYDEKKPSYWCDFISYCLLWFICLECTLGIVRREELRRKYNLEVAPWGDMVVHCFCHPCASCQESRQLEHFVKHHSSPEPSTSRQTEMRPTRSPLAARSRAAVEDVPAVVFERHEDFVVSRGVKQPASPGTFS